MILFDTAIALRNMARGKRGGIVVHKDRSVNGCKRRVKCRGDLVWVRALRGADRCAGDCKWLEMGTELKRQGAPSRG
jgi:hypothetical protein